MKKHLPKLLVLGLVALILFLTYQLGVKEGRSEGERQRTEVMAVLEAERTKYEHIISLLQTEHSKTVKEIEDDLRQSKELHERNLASARTDFAARLQLSENRAGTYKRMSQADSTERDRLADHAARLDSALEEGRYLVRELRETLRQRDRELESLGAQILADRKLME